MDSDRESGESAASAMEDHVPGRLGRDAGRYRWVSVPIEGADAPCYSHGDAGEHNRVIREPDPGIVRGREPTTGDQPHDGEELDALPGLQLAPDPAVADPEPIVDLRPTKRPLVSAARTEGSAPGHGRREADRASVAVPPPPPPEAGPDAAVAPGSPPVGRHSGLADRAVAAVAGPVVVLLVTLLATSVLLVDARSAAGSEAQLVGDAAERLETRVALDDLNAAVLASVAAGVGQAVEASGELARRSDAASAAITAAADSSAVAEPDATVTAADDAATAYVDAVDEAVERTGATRSSWATSCWRSTSGSPQRPRPRPRRSTPSTPRLPTNVPPPRSARGGAWRSRRSARSSRRHSCRSPVGVSPGSSTDRSAGYAVRSPGSGPTDPPWRRCCRVPRSSSCSAPRSTLRPARSPTASTCSNAGRRGANAVG